jgi:hypothetical protein
VKVIGYALIGVGVGSCMLVALWLGSGIFSGDLGLSGGILGFGVAVMFASILIIGGTLLLRKSASEEASDAEGADLRKVLDVVQARGQVRISDLSIEFKREAADIKNLVYKLVGLGVFSGYINWADGVLYSGAAASLRELGECKHCGGKLSLVGKGVVKCPFCETEYFLTA